MGLVEQNHKPSIPIIDFSAWTSESEVSPERRLETALELVEACHTYGFAYIKNHGIPSNLLQDQFAMSRRFFELPTAKKMLAANKGANTFRGYSWPGLENVAKVSDEGITVPGSDKQVAEINESYGLGSESNAREINVWPPVDTLPNFQSLSTKFYWECWRTSQLVLKALALGLKLPNEDFLLKFHTGDDNELSLRHYPPIKASLVEKQEVRRLSAHTDYTSLTLLFQDDCGGLEVEKRGCHGVYIPVDPIEGALVMNIGDTLMRWSNDFLTSTKHRVHLPPLQDRFTGSERMTRERFSIPYFVVPRMDTVVECLPGCSNEDSPLKFEPILFADLAEEQVAAVFG